MVPWPLVFINTYHPRAELCAIYTVVKNVYDSILTNIGTTTVKYVPAMQWSQSKVLGGYYLNNLTSDQFELCPYGTSMYDVAPYNVSLAWYGPPEFSCFLKLHPAAPVQEQNNNQHHMHMHEGFIEPSTLLPRSINTTN